ncbi:hypothetical protein GF389_01365 [Candidatus Dojkabacteria bacterium]|nr:hypothetical protein [Candidatus Dojkabacteria bacterium]
MAIPQTNPSAPDVPNNQNTPKRPGTGENPVTPVSPPNNSPAAPDLGSKSDYKIEDAPQEEQKPPSQVVDLDKEMQIPKEMNGDATGRSSVESGQQEAALDPNVALKNGNTKEGQIGDNSVPDTTNVSPQPSSMSASAVAPKMDSSSSQVMPESTPQPVQVGKENEQVTQTPKETSSEPPVGTQAEGLPASSDESNKIATATSTGEVESQQSTVETTTMADVAEMKNSMHETPSQDKLGEVMSAPTQEVATDMAPPTLPEDQVAEKQIKPKSKGGSNTLMRLVLVFLLLGILAMSAVLAYLLFS